METKEKKLVELLQNEGYANLLFSMPIEDAQKDLLDKGIDLSEEELTAIVEGFRASSNEEISVEVLDNVNGGISTSRATSWAWQLGFRIGWWIATQAQRRCPKI